MFTEDLFFDVDDQRLAATMIFAENRRTPSIAHLHGLGATASRHTVRYFLDEFADRGHGSLTFEYSGNGDSTGVMEQSCLRRRTAESLAAVAQLSTDERPLLIGSSMGAHLACSIVPKVSPRGLVLFVPAAYPRGAEDLLFDEGRARPGNYADNPAFTGLREFDGDLLIVAGKTDQVVPADVVDGYLDNATNARSAEVIWLDCDHFVHRWLPFEETAKTDVLTAMLRVISVDQAEGNSSW
ncbi:alpha/beta hydrolase [Nocardia sp. NBC_01499]|uniref:alpha/beta hydrolase n=1 Tax=Nocardia sp. NBC_01499 TaxID=2903597 RepID=UPI003864992B